MLKKHIAYKKNSTFCVIRVKICENIEYYREIKCAGITKEHLESTIGCSLSVLSCSISIIMLFGERLSQGELRFPPSSYSPGFKRGETKLGWLERSKKEKSEFLLKGVEAWLAHSVPGFLQIYLSVNKGFLPYILIWVFVTFAHFLPCPDPVFFPPPFLQ